MKNSFTFLKKLALLFPVVAMCFTVFKAGATGITYTWNGSSSSVWELGTNWTSTGSDFPGNSDVVGDDIVIIPNVSPKPVLNSNLTYGVATLTINASSSLTVNTGFTLIVTGTTTVNGDLNPNGHGGRVIDNAGSGTLTGTGNLHIFINNQTDDLYYEYAINTLTLTNLTLVFDDAGSHTNHNISCANINVNNGFGVNFNGAFTISVSGTITNTYSITPGASTIISGTITGAGQLVVSHVGSTTDDVSAQYTGTVPYTTATLVYTGASAQKISARTVYAMYVNNSSGVTQTGALVVTTLLAGTGTLLASNSNYTLTVGGDFTLANYTPSNSTVFLNGTSQNVSAKTFFFLTVNSSTGATFTGNVTVNATLSGTGTVNAGATTLSVVTMSVAGFNAGTSTVKQSTGSPTVAYTFYNYEITSGGVSSGVNIIATNFTIDAGAQYIPGATNTITWSGTGTCAGLQWVSMVGTANDLTSQYIGTMTYSSPSNLIFNGASSQILNSVVTPTYIQTNGTSTLTISQNISITQTIVGNGSTLIVAAGNTLGGLISFGAATIRVTATGHTDDLLAQYTGYNPANSILSSSIIDFEGASSQKIADNTLPNVIIGSNGATLTGTTGLVINGNLTGTGTLTATTQTFSVGGNFTAPFTCGTSTVTLGSTTSLGTNTFYKLIINGSTTLAGTVTVNNNLTGSGTLVGSTFNISVGGNFAVTNFTCNTSTVTLTGNGPTLSGVTYYNLMLSTSGGNTAPTGNIVVNGTLTVGSSTVLFPAPTRTISGTGTLTGTGAIYIRASGHTNDFTFQYAMSTLTLTNLSLTFYAAAAPFNINAPISCGNLQVFNQTLNVNSNVAITITGTLTISLSTDKLIPSSGSTISANAIIGSGTLYCSHTGHATNDLTAQYTGVAALTGVIVDFAGSGATQKVPALTYLALIIDNTTGTSQSGNVIVTGTLSGAGILDPATFNLSVGGTVTVTTITAGTGASTVTLTGTSQTVNAQTFNNLAVNSSTGATLTGAITVNGNLTGTGTLSVSSSNYAVSTAGNFTITGFTPFSGTVTLSGTGNASAHTVYNLAVTGTATMTGDIIVGGVLSGSGTLTPGTHNLTVAGNTTITTLTTGTGSSTTTLNGASQNVNTHTFNNLTVSCSGTASLTGATTVNGTLHFTGGMLALGANDLIVGTSGSITGYSSSNYVYTNSTGKLTMKASSGGTVFPVGDDYNPIMITDPSGNTYSVGVANGVTKNDGVTAVTDWAVNRTWTVSSTGSSTVTVAPQWATADLIGADFNTADAFVAHRDITHTNTWTAGAGSPQTGSDPTISQSLTGIGIVAGDVYNFSVGGGALSALPVVLTDFSAAYVSGLVQLEWNTASEINNSYFNIERSTNGQNWITIGRVEGHGNSLVTNHYFSTDNVTELAASGTIYYRLKQVDFNGAFEYSGIRNVNLLARPISMDLFPNPTSSQLNINWMGTTNENAVLKIVNDNGSVVHSETINESGMMHKQLDMSAYPTGIYTIQVVSGNTTTSKLVYKR